MHFLTLLEKDDVLCSPSPSIVYPVQILPMSATSWTVCPFAKSRVACSGIKRLNTRSIDLISIPLVSNSYFSFAEESSANQTGGVKERRLLSSSSVSSISSLSSLRMRHQQVRYKLTWQRCRYLTDIVERWFIYPLTPPPVSCHD